MYECLVSRRLGRSGGAEEQLYGVTGMPSA
jgi:hypothetical protein